MSHPVPVVDLHCDLLLYLSRDDQRSPYHVEARCSFPQLKLGRVFLQTLAIFTETKKGSVASAQLQCEAYKRLAMQECQFLKQLHVPTSQSHLHLIAAIENASGLLEEGEDLEKMYARFDQMVESVGPLLYISLTWNTENRFGGGCHSQVGLKPDGERLLDYMSGKKIAIDLSHASDALAHAILNYIDRKGLNIRPIASHSNFRKVIDHPRNLPDDLAREIISRGGVIGLNFVRAFVGGFGDYETGFLKIIEHAKHLDALDHFCFGADFFYEEDVAHTLSHLLPFFVEPYHTSSCYPQVFKLLQKQLNQEEMHALGYKNITRFFERQQC